MVDDISEDRSEAAFGDYKSGYSAEQAKIEADRCLFCSDAPCTAACPTNIDVPQFIRKIATGNVRGAARTIFDANVLGMSCARVCPVEVLCVGDCVYNQMGVPPIQIGKLQRFATDVAYERRWRFATAGPTSGRSVGLVGCGPASLAAAHELRRLGHACTIYERRGVPGGLNTWGVAPYKMRADRAIAEARWILDIGGVTLRTRTCVGTDIEWTEIERRHDAVFVGVGLGPDTMLGTPGESLDGVFGALEFIEKMKLGKVSVTGLRNAVVIGGGNTAIDAVRETLGLGIPSTTLIYRRVEGEMPGYRHEWHAALEQGARAEWRALPVAYEGSPRVRRVRCLRVDENRRPIEGSEFSLDADLVLVAIGQSTLGDSISSVSGIAVDRGRIVVDERGRTGRRGYFAGGDCANGGKEVVNAAAEGKAAALAIHEYLTGGERA